MLESDDASRMANEKQLSVRLPTETVDRADALVPVLAELPALAGFRVERASVLRLAIAHGLRVLEQEHGVTPPPARKPRKRRA
jgi:predicted DNA-binding protein